MHLEEALGINEPSSNFSASLPALQPDRIQPPQSPDLGHVFSINYLRQIPK